MTAEVCIMNRLAVVLAADSAATVTQWKGDKFEQRFFKGSNKIFQLSDHQPVGIMIFDSADVLRVPWEIVVKAFRAQLARKSFNTVREYAAEFFAFLESSPILFPSSVQDEVFLENARTAAVLVPHRSQVPDEDAARLAENHQITLSRKQFLEQLPFYTTLDQSCLDAAMAKFKPLLSQGFENLSEDFAKALPEDRELLAEVGILEVCKLPYNHLGKSGLIFAGFGDHEIFPAFAEFKSCGLICDKHVAVVGEAFSITHDVPARLASFAQTAMSDTFSLGVSEDVYRSVMRTLEAGLSDFARSVISASGGDMSKVDNFDEMVSQARKTMGDAVLNDASDEHALPLRRVLGVLPVDEMAELAETLINLQALKEKVTKNTETVGGPVDVAIITKNEGLVWVKRKHFFDAQLNSRYVARQQSRLAQ